MTLLPADDFGITGYPGNKYDVNEICAHPSCNQRAVHAHHMWSRSFLRKDYDWVKLPDGVILGNRIGLCQEHHDMVTGEIGGYRAKLEWVAGVMWWVDRVAQSPAEEVREGVKWATLHRQMLTTQPPVYIPGEQQVTELASAHGHVDDDEKICPVCGHHKQHKEPRAKLERRNVKEWTINVPDDAEIGADVLDGWVDDFAIPMGATDWSPRLRRYYVLVTVLAWANIHRGQFIQDMADAAERRTA